MNRHRKINLPDFILGIVTMAVSAGYLVVTSQIQESMLSDAVGAGGVPTALGWSLAALGLIVCVRSLIFRTPKPDIVVTATAKGDDDEKTPEGMRPHLLALGLLAILAAYVLITPYLGYIASTALLIAASARFCGLPLSRRLLIISFVGGLGLWVMFDPMLSTSMPVGKLWGGR